MAQPGDIVMFEFPDTPIPGPNLVRTASTYGRVELLPVPGEMYVLCYDGGFQHWSPTDDTLIGWEFSILNGVPMVRTAQTGFEPIEIRMRTIGRTNTPPENTRYGTIDEGEDDDDEVTSRRSKIGCVLA